MRHSWWFFLGTAAYAGLFLADCSARGGGPGGGGGVIVDDTGTSDNDSGTPVGCGSSQVRCSGTCVDVTRDNANCGTCGRACPSGQSCMSGACRAGTPTCESPSMMCGSACVDVTSDPNNCGRCGSRCTTSQTCDNGFCVGGSTTCSPPQVACSGRCVDTRSDANHCGVCGFVCSVGERCSNGICMLGGGTCSAPQVMCSGGCVDTRTSSSNCGACGRACSTGQSCSGGVCTTSTTCPSGQTSCSGRCVSTLSDSLNCGACGRTCTSTQRCTNGVCVTGTTTVTAGRACTSDATCGELTCTSLPGGRICTDPAGCEQGTSSFESSQCGGTGSTCLVLGATTAMEQISFCTAACTPGGGTCGTGAICTTNWLQLETGQMENPGCFPFCDNDSQCVGVMGADASLMRCNRRTGRCATAPSDSTLRADGQPCNPMLTTPQCRGVCFLMNNNNRTQGLCGSFINLRSATTCPDDAANIQPRAPQGEELGICIFRDCTTSTQCGSGLICIYPESAGRPDTSLPRICQYPTAAQPR